VNYVILTALESKKAVLECHYIKQANDSKTCPITSLYPVVVMGTCS